MAAQKTTPRRQAWFCTDGLSSDVVVEVDYTAFHLHKFALVSKSKKLHDLISEQEAATKAVSDRGKEIEVEERDVESEIEVENCHISLSDFPGGSETFEVAAKFCYGVKIDISATNVAALRCAGEVLQMTEECSKDNLISRAERYLSRSVFRNLRDSIAALESCEILTPMAEELGIVERCIDTISAKAVVVDSSLFGWPINDTGYAGVSNHSPSIAGGRYPKARNSKSTPSISKTGRREPWFEDLSTLRYDFFDRVLEAMKGQGVSSEVIESCLFHYAKKSFPGINRTSRKAANKSAITSIASEAEQRMLLESIVAHLPAKKCPSSARTARYLFGLLRTANILKSSENCKCSLERKIGAQLEQASLDDLLIPSYSYLNDTLYDVDCVERIFGYFIDSYDERSGEGLAESFNDSSVRSPAIMLVGKLMDGYLSEIASDANLKPEQFCSLGLSLPNQARLYDDGLYRAVDLYLKAHPWITDSESERICEVINFQKLTLEACSHASQNERLPLRAVVQVLHFEQLQLRHAIAAGTTILSSEAASPMERLPRLSIQRYNVQEDERPETSRWRAAVRENQVLRLDMSSVRTRVQELERECSTMKRAIERFDKRKSSFASKFGCKFNTQVCDSHDSTAMEGGRRGRYVTSHAHYPS